MFSVDDTFGHFQTAMCGQTVHKNITLVGQFHHVFIDLISFKLLDTLSRDELLLRLLQEKFLYLLVDEHQDSNDAQNSIITALTNFFETPNVFIVGDEKQAIYRFQGASVENFLRFEKRWPTMTMINLEDNYRSHQHILDASFSMIENNYSEGEHQNLRIELRAHKDSKKPIDIIMAPDVETVERHLVD
jgi:DNA helicase-2/ATP-dependent DNA helicase PcrA